LGLFGIDHALIPESWCLIAALIPYSNQVWKKHIGSHVSMYMGGGKMVQAPRPGKKVEVVNFTKMFGKKPFVGARRL
jgi:cell wall-associated NlpC family hydrolase